MPAVRGGMGNHSGAVTGEGKVLRINQPKADRRQYSKNGKDFLECGMWIVSGRLSVQDIICDIPAGNRAGVLRFLQFSIGANQFFLVFCRFCLPEEAPCGNTGSSCPSRSGS